jgi:hypothetical protein
MSNNDANSVHFEGIPTKTYVHKEFQMANDEKA